MGKPHASFASRAAVAAAMIVALATLSACGTVQRIKGTEDGASNESDARNVNPRDILAKPTQVGWTSARASHCGFVFDPAQLRSNNLASEVNAGRSRSEMMRIEQAYDYTRESVHATIKDSHAYCNKERTDAIREALNRYLAGDYTPSARMAR